MKIVLTGSGGNIGSRLVKNYRFTPLDVDIRWPGLIAAEINKVKPDVIIHLAGKSNVNWCEKLENQETVQQINFRGSANVFEQAIKLNIPVVFVSSDHVFSGNGFGSYKEDAKPFPKNFYGMSKFAAESLSAVYPNVHIVRTSTNFWDDFPPVYNALADIWLGKDVHVPVYMWRSFLHIDHFCELLAAYCQSALDANPKVLNLSGSKVVSWYKFIRDLAHERGLDTDKVHPKYFEDDNHNYAPRAFRAGLNVNLSKKLGYHQYSYLDGIK